ncbi:3'-5' exonuclease [Cytophaga hutchinsonii]|jgi:DNA polymerase-3 subunit epsilon|uniref:DNA polymerase III epsilon subunit n=1 Tax=Cytophaga hutchinsonii (strain ATCC 33406 / DSM 1761 / CIP 103989 / NBRC 15051 / NCIMB 9469 / D465) TaxID=269798 RepID=A0A6N4SQM4_CYTH3|nr:3'-5' exonuclease [Cytophaga hutchinsonii]ABG58619.1 DNA polymerase III epsilon subunit [Cytophaga hutchinsonii ATCC 33406]SFX58172.1 DNA polymerase-3 subunit epsilon [Cytophaga hutchinsonii ATCC 33406]
MTDQLPLFDAANAFKMKINKPIAFFDLETTGVNISTDRIIEICIVRVSPPDEKVEVKTFRVNPGMPIPDQSSAIHGIYDKDVADKPTFTEIAHQINQFMKDCDLGGFNSIRFDIPLLIEEFFRAGIEFDITKRKLVDSQRIFHLMEPRTLGAAYKFYCNKDLENAHSAEADTLATYYILKAQIERYADKQIKDAEGKVSIPIKNDMQVLHDFSVGNMVDLAGRMIMSDKGEELFNFGKYKGMKVKDTLVKDPMYYDWIMKGDFPQDTKKKLTQIKLKNFGGLK